MKQLLREEEGGDNEGSDVDEDSAYLGESGVEDEDIGCEGEEDRRCKVAGSCKDSEDRMRDEGGKDRVDDEDGREERGGISEDRTRGEGGREEISGSVAVSPSTSGDVNSLPSQDAAVSCGSHGACCVAGGLTTHLHAGEDIASILAELRVSQHSDPGVPDAGGSVPGESDSILDVRGPDPDIPDAGGSASDTSDEDLLLLSKQ